MNKILENKTALITGSGRGIGEALAIGFAKLGANIILTARTLDQIEATKNKIIEAGGKAIAVAGDIQKYDDVVNVVKKGIEAFGKIDILINNAGYSKIKPITRLRVEEFQGMIATNITGVFNATHAVVPGMIENKGGAIINTGSVAITFAMPNWSVYAMTKSALTSFTTCLAEELKQSKVTVNTVMPNMVHTPMLHAGRTEEQIKAMDAIQPEELVPYYAFLASDEGKKVTGLNINIDTVKAVLALKQKLPTEQQATANWSLLEPLATEALNPDQLKDAKKYRKIITFLLENPQ